MHKIRVRSITREAGVARIRQRHLILTDSPVSSVMSRPAVCVRATDTLGDALRMFVATGVRHVAVVDGTGRCVGLLSDRVLTGAWAHNPMAFTYLTVAAVMGKEQSVLPRGATIVSAARVMHRQGTDAVVVVDQNLAPVGVLTANDVIALVATSSR